MEPKIVYDLLCDDPIHWFVTFLLKYLCKDMNRKLGTKPWFYIE